MFPYAACNYDLKALCIYNYYAYMYKVCIYCIYLTIHVIKCVYDDTYFIY